MRVHRKPLLDHLEGLFVPHVPPVLALYIDHSKPGNVTPTGFFSILERFHTNGLLEVKIGAGRLRQSPQELLTHTDQFV